MVLPDGVAGAARRYCSVSSPRVLVALILQLSLLALPFAGAGAHDRHCAEHDSAPAQTMDLKCHSLPACATPVMQVSEAVVVEPVAVVTLVVNAAAPAPLSVSYTPEPPPPRA